MRFVLLGVVLLIAACHAPHAVADAGTSVALQVVSVTPGVETPANADWVAFQSGSSGSWTVLSGEAGSYDFQPTSADGRFGLVVVCPQLPDQPRSVQSYQGTLSERAELKVGCAGAPSGPAVPLDVVSTGWDSAATQAQAILENATFGMTAEGSLSPVVSLPPGQGDLLAYTLTSTGDVPQLALVRSVPIDATDPHVAVTFAPAASVTPSSVLYTLTGTDDDDIGVTGSASLVTLNASVLPLPALGAAPALPSPTFETVTVPQGLVLPGDFQVVTLSASDRHGFNLQVIQSTRAPGASSFSLPPSLMQASFAVQEATGARAAWNGGPSGAGAWLRVSQSTSLQWDVVATAGFLQGTLVQAPDPSAATGWDASWTLRSDLPLSWTLDVVQGELNLIVQRAGPPLRGGYDEALAFAVEASGTTEP